MRSSLECRRILSIPQTGQTGTMNHRCLRAVAGAGLPGFGAALLALSIVTTLSCVPQDGGSVRDADFFDDPPIVSYPEGGARKGGGSVKSKVIVGRKLPAATFEEFLALPDDRIDYAHGAFLFAKLENPSLNADAFLDQIDDAVSDVTRKLRGGESGVKTVEILNDYLFIEKGYRFDSSDPEGEKPENLYLDQVMKRKKGYCVSLALLYLCVGLKLGLPLHGVRVPSHFIVRYDDGKDVVNVETTDHGLANPNSYYASKYRIGPKSVEKGVYLRNLKPREVFVDLMNNRGTLLGMQGHASQAVDVFDRALKVDSKAASVYYNRGVMKMRLKKMDEARKDFESCLDLDENNVQALTNLSEILKTGGDFASAVETINRAINILPAYSNGYAQRGLIFLGMGRKQLAVENLDKAIELDEKNAAAYMYRARIRRDDGDLKRAVLDLNCACQISPRDSMCFAERALAHFLLGMNERAIEDFDEAVRLDDRVAEYRMNRGLVRLKMGDRNGAREDFDSGIRLAPENPAAWAKRAAVEILDGNLEKALAFLDEAVSRDRNHAPALLNRGAVFVRLGRYGEAAADLMRCIHLNPAEPEAYRHLGMAYFKSGDRNQAVFFLGKYVGMAGAKADAEALEALKTLGK